MQPSPIFLEPLYQDRVWGGRELAHRLGRRLPEGRVIGEAWEVVDRPEAQSVVREGVWAGRTLRDLILRETAFVMGEAWPAPRPFPVLVKWLDCRERLSLQVHPPREVCEQLRGEPKTENWYIAHADPGAALMVGLRRGVTRRQFEEALRQDRAEPLVHRTAVAAGDSLLVRSGQLHAIDAGNLILEIQQNSDTTYRVYDWGRLGLDGQPRQLHIEPSLASIDFSHFEPEPLRARELPDRGAVLADASEFRIRQWRLPTGAAPVELAGGEARLLSVVSGAAEIRGPQGARWTAAWGENALLPAASAFIVHPGPEAVVLVTDRFSRP